MHGRGPLIPIFFRLSDKFSILALRLFFFSCLCFLSLPVGSALLCLLNLYLQDPNALIVLVARWSHCVLYQFL